MELAKDVASIVLNEIEREDGESQFIMEIILPTPNGMKVRGFFVKNALKFQIFAVYPQYSNFLFNLKTDTAVSHLIAEQIKRETQNLQEKLCSFSIIKGETLLFTFTFDAGDLSEGLVRLKVGTILNTYIEICKCNKH